MMDAVKAALIGLDVPEAQIRTEAFGTVKRDPTARGAASEAIAGTVFQTSNTTAPVRVGFTILDAADEAGIFHRQCLPFGNVRLMPRKARLGRRAYAAVDALTNETATFWLAKPKSAAMSRSMPRRMDLWIHFFGQ